MTGAGTMTGASGGYELTEGVLAGVGELTGVFSLFDFSHFFTEFLNFGNDLICFNSSVISMYLSLLQFSENQDLQIYKNLCFPHKTFACSSQLGPPLNTLQINIELPTRFSSQGLSTFSCVSLRYRKHHGGGRWA